MQQNLFKHLKTIKKMIKVLESFNAESFQTDLNNKISEGWIPLWETFKCRDEYFCIILEEGSFDEDEEDFVEEE